MFEESEAKRWLGVMDKAIQDFVPPIALRDPEHQYWSNSKISEELMEPVLSAFFRELETPALMRKKHHYHLIDYLDSSEIHQDVITVLDGIAAQASAVGGATPG